VAEFELKFEHKHFIPLDEVPKVVEREDKVPKPAGLAFKDMTEVQLVNMEYYVRDLREALEEDYQIKVPANMPRAQVIRKFVEARDQARK
jgi:acetone carboxylase gamma subunit